MRLTYNCRWDNAGCFANKKKPKDRDSWKYPPPQVRGANRRRT